MIVENIDIYNLVPSQIKESAHKELLKNAISNPTNITIDNMYDGK